MAGLMPKVGSRVRVMDPWFGDVECFRGTVVECSQERLYISVRPDRETSSTFRVDGSWPGTALPLDDNVVCRWARRAS